MGTTPLDSLDLPLEGGSLRKVQATGILFTKEVGVTRNTLDVRFAVRDRITGLIGTISTPVKTAVEP